MRGYILKSPQISAVCEKSYKTKTLVYIVCLICKMRNFIFDQNAYLRTICSYIFLPLEIFITPLKFFKKEGATRGLQIKATILQEISR